MTHEYNELSLFTDPKNLTVGNTRVIWAKATDSLPEGWVLPGGFRAQNFAEAHAAACRMYDLDEKASKAYLTAKRVMHSGCTL